jgi:hypothetical protein
LNDSVKLTSNKVRIQDFFREAELDYGFVAVLLSSLLPAKGKLHLCIDQTEWNFGSCQVNVPMIIAGVGSMQVPLYWELLDNKTISISSLLPPTKNINMKTGSPLKGTSELDGRSNFSKRITSKEKVMARSISKIAAKYQCLFFTRWQSTIRLNRVPDPVRSSLLSSQNQGC